jgi:hypothetical protein
VTDKPQKSLSSVEEFFAADGVDYDTVPIRGGKTIRIASITAEDWVEWTTLRDSGPDGKKKAGALLISKSVVNDEGDRFLAATGDEVLSAATVTRIQKLGLPTNEKLLKAIFKLNGITSNNEAVVKNG